MKRACPSQAGLLRRLTFLLACAALCGACSTSPTSGRTQFNILPEPLETRVPDIRFEVHTLLTSKGEYCSENESPCTALEQAEKLTQRMAPMAERLGKLAVDLSPELAKRVPLVEVFVVAKDSPSVISSAGGKIAVSSSMAQLDLSDTDLAFALAREFGRLAAAHHRESTSAGLAVSLLAGSPLTGAYLATTILADLLFPMGTLLKLGISLIGSMGTEQLVEISQQEEADAFAGKLMLAAGYDLRDLAKPNPGLEEGTVKIGWLPRFVASRAKVASMAPPPETATKVAADQKAAPNMNMNINSAPDTPPAETPPPELIASEVAVVEAVPETKELVVASDAQPAETPPPVLIASEMAVVQAVPETKEVAVASDARPTETLKPKDAPPKAEPTKAQGAKKSAGKKSKKKKRKPSKEKKRP